MISIEVEAGAQTKADRDVVGLERIVDHFHCEK